MNSAELAHATRRIADHDPTYEAARARVLDAIAAREPTWAPTRVECMVGRVHATVDSNLHGEAAWLWIRVAGHREPALVDKPGTPSEAQALAVEIAGLINASWDAVEHELDRGVRLATVIALLRFAWATGLVPGVEPGSLDIDLLAGE
jgi:hypothetical protein